MNGLIDKYLTLLDDAASIFPDSLWFCTSLSSKNRFDVNNQNLIKNLSQIEEIKNNFLEINLSPKKFGAIKKIRAATLLCSTAFSLLKKSIIYKKPFYWKKLSSSKKEFILIKSFLFEKDLEKKDDFDAYFGKIPYLLNSDKVEVIVLSDCIGGDIKFSHFCNKEINFVPVYALISPIDVISQLIKIISLGLSKKGWISQEILKNTTFVNSFYEIIFTRVFRNLPIKAGFYTFENNPWEKVFVASAKLFNVPTYGFQHVPFAPSALNYYFTDKEKRECFPDYVVTTGSIPRDILVNDYNVNADKLINGFGFRFKSLESQSIKSKKGKKVLVGLEGVGNCAFLMNYIFNNNTYFKENGFEITFRFHPAFQLDRMKSFITEPSLINQDHVIISTKTLQEDFEENDILLYWGSTVSFEALSYGLWLVNLCPKDELFSNDQLWNYQATRVSEEETIPPENLFQILEKLRSSPKGQELQREGQIYLKNYLRPWSDLQVREWLIKSIIN